MSITATQAIDFIQEINLEAAALRKENIALKAEVAELKGVPVAKPEWEVKADTVIAIAKALDALGIPYVFGGESIKGMDCSGFVQFIYKQVGVSMNRVSKNQATQGTQINKKDSKVWRKGDLVAFDYSKNGEIDHIGIYLGNGTMIHTNTPATGINIKAVNHTTSGLVSVNRVL
jgi:cell wall-associated NlpC family hydrolase